MELGVDDAACALDGFGLVVEEAGGADEVFEGLDGGFGHGLGCGVGGEECGRDEVDADVSALGREYGGDEEFPGGAVGKGALGVGVVLVEELEYLGEALGAYVALCRRPGGVRRRPGLGGFCAGGLGLAEAAQHWF